MKIALMGAMEEEIEPLLKKVDNIQKVRYLQNDYYIATYKNLDLVIAYSKIGKVFSTITATTLIEHFKCEMLLFSGVAGAINDKLNIGDLIVASKLCQHDLDISAFGHPFGFVPEGSVYIETSTKLIDMAMKIANKNKIKLTKGIIATGDQFICDKTKKEWIRDNFNADALEMEGASVANVCSLFDIPFFILRAISDSADMDAEFNFDEFLKSSASNSANFIVSMLDEINSDC
jgi:adenosylhomocysteine/aminodeoxyfutalosine nucleosidase